MTSIAQLIAKRFANQLGNNGNRLFAYLTRGLQRMKGLVDDLLAYAQASHFEIDEDRHAPLDSTLQLTLENLRAEIERTAATVSAEALPVIAAHETHVIQLLQNVVSNALKYRKPTAPPHVRIWSQQQDSAWVIHVEDNGIGIPPQYAEHIFKPFKRLHGEEVPGSGIGLATCQKIVEGYGGRIWVDSEPGKGSTFHFTLPARSGRVSPG